VHVWRGVSNAGPGGGNLDAVLGSIVLRNTRDGEAGAKGGTASSVVLFLRGGGLKGGLDTEIGILVSRHDVDILVRSLGWI